MTATAMGALRADRDAILELGTGLTEAGWAAASGCPGWSAKDVVAHLGALLRLVIDPSSLPDTSGLGLLHGECERFPSNVKSPHVGWNQLEVNSSSRLLRGVPSASFVYFTHSFRAPVTETTVACCEYGGRFSAAVEREHVFGVQFHPEKSGAVGLKMLNNFCEI